MTYKLGLPYMGSKRKIAKDLVDFILKDSPNTKHVYDLFGGGGAMSFEFLQRPQIEKVFYNEFNKGVVELLKDIKDSGITSKYYQWVDRETFNKHKLDPTWFGGFLQVVWSFGNNQRDYLYGKHIEQYKMWLHKIIVENSQEHLDLLNEKFDLSLSLDILNDYKSINDRRLKFMKVFKEVVKDFKINTQLQHLNSLERLVSLERVNKLTMLEKLKSQVQHLERLEQVNKLDKLDISCNSYENVKISTPIDETIIYLDPPYQNTKRYELQIDHNKLWEYIKNSPYKIYLSSYEAPFEEVYQVSHRSTLSATNNSKRTVEKLFINRR